jgi:hypothetical protein
MISMVCALGLVREAHDDERLATLTASVAQLPPLIIAQAQYAAGDVEDAGMTISESERRYIVRGDRQRSGHAIAVWTELVLAV